jgi:hypothetical protein
LAVMFTVLALHKSPLRYTTYTLRYKHIAM